MNLRNVAVMLLPFAWSLPAMATEEPSYAVVEREGLFEIRDYKAMTVAETVVSGDFEAAGGAALYRSLD